MRGPIFADTDLLIRGRRGYAPALDEILTGVTFVTSSQFREFLDVSGPRERKLRRSFLDSQGIHHYLGLAARLFSRSPAFGNTFSQVARDHGRGDAALAAFARETGYTAVTMERRLYNYLTWTRPDLGVPIRRVI